MGCRACVRRVPQTGLDSTTWWWFLGYGGGQSGERVHRTGAAAHHILQTRWRPQRWWFLEGVSALGKLESLAMRRVELEDHARRRTCVDRLRKWEIVVSVLKRGISLRRTWRSRTRGSCDASLGPTAELQITVSEPQARVRASFTMRLRSSGARARCRFHSSRVDETRPRRGEDRLRSKLAGADAGRELKFEAIIAVFRIIGDFVTFCAFGERSIGGL
ncbi:hypothetical protein FB451DRAFT_653819 [Mycena latifolia]|nr:hypothetical protein FB451DRAFT_653819 [Mycena latifolia]